MWWDFATMRRTKYDQIHDEIDNHDQCRSHDHSDHDFELTMDGVTGPAGAHSRPHCD